MQVNGSVEHILKSADLAGIDMIRGRNCYLYAKGGKRYVDLESGTWAAALGHCHPRITRVLRSQAGRLVHLGTRHPNHVVEQAARDVLAITGIEDGRCIFLC